MAHSWGGLGWFQRCVWHRGTGTARMKDKDGQGVTGRDGDREASRGWKVLAQRGRP